MKTTMLLVLAIVLISVEAIIIGYIWNHVLIGLTGWGSITFMQSLWLLLLGNLLSGGLSMRS